MKIIAIEKETPYLDTEAFKPYLKPEAFKVWELYQAGIIREAYFRQDRPDAVLILECVDADTCSKRLGLILLSPFAVILLGQLAARTLGPLHFPKISQTANIS